MNDQELIEKLQHEAFKQQLKNNIENNPYYTRQQKDYFKERVDVAAQQADQMTDLIKMMRQMGLMP